ncbi:hypothetical protein ON010_g11353 [Phytophthora cinnamomi]|nr:hypothetical protein ON010_g11353 [Phytophthora cinnamomi]
MSESCAQFGQLVADVFEEFTQLLAARSSNNSNFGEYRHRGHASIPALVDDILSLVYAEPKYSPLRKITSALLLRKDDSLERASRELFSAFLEQQKCEQIWSHNPKAVAESPHSACSQSESSPKSNKLFYTLRAALHVGELHYNDKMASSSDSDDDRRKSKTDKKFRINSSGNPVNWDGENWPFYKKSMKIVFQKSLLEDIASGKVTADPNWSQEKKDEHTKKQAKIQMLIMGSLTTRLSQQLLDQDTGTAMWGELCKIYEGKNNDATKAQKVYRLQVRELILTAETRNKDWEKNAFGSNQGKKKQGTASSGPKGKTTGDGSKKKTSRPDVKCFNCGGKCHYKSDCPDLEEKPSAERKASAKMTRSGEKPVKISSEKTDDDTNWVHKRDVVVGEVVKRVAKDCDASRWYFDSGTNAHIVATKEYFTVLNNMEDSDWNPNISGFADGVDAKSEGFGTILLATTIDGQALEQGFKMSWEQETMMFGMTKDGTEVLRAVHEHRLWAFNVHNIGGVKVDKKTTAVKKQIVVNFAVTDGVEDIDVWHARLGHICPEYIRLMVDRGMAKGIMLKRRGKMDCTDCHFGKQRRKTFKKSLDRNIVNVNDMVFADLLIPGLHNGTKYSAVLVVMDGFSRFVTTYLLNSKTEDEVNGYMKQYIAWAERQHGRKVDTVVTRRWCAEEESSDEQDEAIGPVKQVLTDKGAEFCNKTIEHWYATKGIVHTKVGPKSSQLNLVERTHQTLIGMVKTMMHDSGLPRSFWMHALQTAVYIKNRVFCKGAGRTPYEMMYGTKPDIHHIRTFGSLVYCHTPVAKRKKLSVILTSACADIYVGTPPSPETFIFLSGPPSNCPSSVQTSRNSRMSSAMASYLNAVIWALISGVGLDAVSPSELAGATCQLPGHGRLPWQHLQS